MTCGKNKYHDLKAKLSFTASCGIVYNQTHLDLPDLMEGVIYDVELDNGAKGGLAMAGNAFDFTLCFPRTEVIQIDSCVRIKKNDPIVCDNQVVEPTDILHTYEYDVKRTEPCK